jgi:ATP-binding cassette, subfamily C (CFTR/MRP), member 1
MKILAEDEKANILSRLTYWYFTKMLKAGSQHTLSEEDLYPLGTRSTAEHLSAKFKTGWSKQLEKGRERPSIYKALWAVSGGQLTTSSICAFIGYELNVISPLVMRAIITWITMKYNGQDPPLWQGYTYVIVLFVMQVVQSVLINSAFAKAMRSGNWMRTALVCEIYQKSLRLSNKSKQVRPLSLCTIKLLICWSVGFFRISRLERLSTLCRVTCLALTFQCP